jgi:hypothetical protein
MGSKFASGQNALAICDRCGFRFRAKQLKQLIIKTKNVNLLVCGECWESDQPQLQLGMYPIEDPQALRNPRPDSTYLQAGIGSDGQPTQGSRIIEWGWAPVGGSRFNDAGLTPNNLALKITLGSVTVVTT